MSERDPYPRIEDYAFLSDCHAVALVSRLGSIDWCCMPRVDSPAFFGRLLDWEKGGHCSMAPIAVERCEVTRRYLEESLVLETRFRGEGGEVRLVDCFAMRRGGRHAPHRELIRVVEGVEGSLDVEVVIAPRFDYGRTCPWLRRHSERHYTAIGGSSGLLLTCDVELEINGAQRVSACATVRAGERLRLSLRYLEPYHLYPEAPEPAEPGLLDARLEDAIEWWRRWASRLHLGVPDEQVDRRRLLRSATVLKGLTCAPTGAIAAAATTSLPEAIGGERNWDYRYAWVRDASFAMRTLSRVGCIEEATGFRRFMERTTAGGANEIAVLYGVGGESLYPEIELDWLEGYRGSSPVRLGNAAHQQLQIDVFGELVEVAWHAFEQGREPDDDYWTFLRSLIDHAGRVWSEEDSGIWELRTRRGHLVHSKVMCWLALDRGIRIAEATDRDAPLDEWRRIRDEIRREVETRGYNEERGTFVHAYNGDSLDAALLQLPRVGFVDYRDPRMVRTTDAIRERLLHGGLVRRYDARDGFESQEGVFLACSFWLAAVLVHQGRRELAEELFERAAGAANDVGLFSEELDPESGLMLGNFPQGLTHYAHIEAALALAGR